MYVCGYSSAIDQSGGCAVLGTMPRGVDSEGDEEEDDREVLADSDASYDSDPELASPLVIRQTNLGVFTFLPISLLVMPQSLCVSYYSTTIVQ